MARGRRVTLTRNISTLTTIVRKGGKNAEFVIDNLRAHGDNKKLSRIYSTLNKDLDLLDSHQVDEFVSALSLLEDALRSMKKRNLKKILTKVKKIIIEMVINQEIPEFLGYTPLNAEYVQREKPGLGETSFFFNTSELLLKGVVFSVDKEGNIDVSPAMGTHHSGLDYASLFDILENGTAKIPARPFFSVIVKYTEILCKKFLFAEGFGEI